MLINNSHKGYPEQRNILYNQQVTFKQSIDLFKLLCHVSFRVLKRIPTWTLNLYWNPLKNNKSILHFFNGICLSQQNFVTTFETALPRIGNTPSWLNNWAIKRLASKNCVALIALSECTAQIQLQNIANSKYKSAIKKKIQILHPPQALYNNKQIHKQTEIIHFTFVGNQFFGKGGREMLKVFTQLYEQGYNYQLNIISNFSADSYASHTSQKDVEKLKEEFKSLPHNNIHILGSLPNAEVIALLQNSHVALMPTYADTYGYFVLEAQACACPVITTDIRALPEINNNECGWLINVPKDNLGNGILATKQERQLFSNKMETQLYNIIKDILDHPQQIEGKGNMAMQRIKKEHCPEKHAAALSKIYSRSN